MCSVYNKCARFFCQRKNTRNFTRRKESLLIISAHVRVTVLSGLHDERSKARRAGCHNVGGSNENLPLNVLKRLSPYVSSLFVCVALGIRESSLIFKSFKGKGLSQFFFVAPFALAKLHNDLNMSKKKGARENDRWEGKINNPSFPSFRNSQFLDCPSLSSALLTECW